MGGTGEMWQLWPCCDRVGADITVLREREVDYDSDTPRKITEVLVRKVPDNQQVGPHPSRFSHPCSLGKPSAGRLVPGLGLRFAPWRLLMPFLFVFFGWTGPLVVCPGFL